MKNKFPDTCQTITITEEKSLYEEIVIEINFARSDPEQYLEKVVFWRKTVKPKYNFVIVNDKQVVINDIEQCFDDLINYLSFVKAMNKVQLNDTLNSCADEMLSIISSSPYNEENLSKNIVDLEKRLKKKGILHGVIAESVEYGID